MRRFLVLVLGLLAVGLAWGKGTPDGKPPAEEGVCDELRDPTVTRGLYGLCVAYCEAQDCEIDIGSDDPFGNCKPGSPRLLENYNRRKQAGDPDMPCVRSPCPCWSRDELFGLRFPAAGDFTSCVLDRNGATFLNLDQWAVVSPSGDTTVLTTIQATNAGLPVCQLTDTCNDGGCLNVNRDLLISPDQFQVCERELRQAADARGLDCEGPLFPQFPN